MVSEHVYLGASQGLQETLEDKASEQVLGGGAGKRDSPRAQSVSVSWGPVMAAVQVFQVEGKGGDGSGRQEASGRSSTDLSSEISRELEGVFRLRPS